jgi:hypothetical protein
MANLRIGDQVVSPSATYVATYAPRPAFPPPRSIPPPCPRDRRDDSDSRLCRRPCFRSPLWLAAPSDAPGALEASPSLRREGRGCHSVGALLVARSDRMPAAIPMTTQKWPRLRVGRQSQHPCQV